MSVCIGVGDPKEALGSRLLASPAPAAATSWGVQQEMDDAFVSPLLSNVFSNK